VKETECHGYVAHRDSRGHPRYRRGAPDLDHTGMLMRPTLTVHTSYDPIIPSDSADYAGTVQRAAGSDNFVQPYVKHDGHCNIGG
jgi:hypothetical protein